MFVVYVCFLIDIYIHKHIDTYTKRHIDIYIHKHIDTYTKRHIDIYTHKLIDHEQTNT